MLKIWDLFVRLSHWLIVLLVISAWLSANFGDAEYKWHSWNGYAIFVLVATRIIWGFVGSTTARFSHFLKLPHTVIRYLIQLITGKEDYHLGHNPAGGWMVFFLLFVLLAQAVTGMFTADDIAFEGPFAYYVSGSWVKQLTSWHHFIFDVILVLVAAHIVAVVYHQFFKKEKLVQAMLTGNKPFSSSSNLEQSALIFKPFFYALIILLIIAGTFWWLLNNYA